MKNLTPEQLKSWEGPTLGAGINDEDGEIKWIKWTIPVVAAIVLVFHISGGQLPPIITWEVPTKTAE